jgi:hypothetical protein
MDRFVQVTVFALENLKFETKDLNLFHPCGFIHGLTRYFLAPRDPNISLLIDSA